MSACKSCPFREGSAMAYDADAMECLDDGNEPACHSKVGVGAIFAHAPLSPVDGTRCAGHDLWEAGTPGFAKPALISINAGRTSKGT